MFSGCWLDWETLKQNWRKLDYILMSNECQLEVIESWLGSIEEELKNCDTAWGKNRKKWILLREYAHVVTSWHFIVMTIGHGFVPLIHPTPLLDIHLKSFVFATDLLEIWYTRVFIYFSLNDKKAFDFKEREVGVSDSGVCPLHHYKLL